MATVASLQVLLIGFVVVSADNVALESRMSDNMTVPVPIPIRMALNNEMYSQGPMVGPRISYQPAIHDDDEEYQQTMRDVGLRPIYQERPTNNYQDHVQPSSFFPSNNNFNPYRRPYAAINNFYPQPTVQRIVSPEKQTESTKQVEVEPELNIQPGSFQPAGAPHIDVAMSAADLANFLQNSNFALLNPNQNFRNNFEFQPQPPKQQSNSFGPMMGSSPSIFVPAVAFTQSMNTPYKPLKSQMRPMGSQGANLMSANTLTMPMFFAPNMGMTRMNMPYPNTFNPMIYPSPMFIPNVNPYAPFFPKKTKNKQKVKSENRDDNEELFEDDNEEIEE